MKTNWLLWKNVVTVMMVFSAVMTAKAEIFDGLRHPCIPASSECEMDFWRLKGKSLWSYGGWMEVGIYGNQYGQRNSYDADGWREDSGNTNFLQTASHSDFQMNQAWLYLAKARRKHGFDYGGRIDAAYGTDGRFLQSKGLEIRASNEKNHWGSGDYFLALPQMYAELGYDNFDVKVGKFLNPLGYESVMSPDRFFYSASYSYGVLPNTLGGALATWQINPAFTVYGGWGKGEKFFCDREDNAFVGGIVWQGGKRLNISYGLISGSIDQPAMMMDTDYYMQSLVVDFLVTDRLEYVFEWTLLNRTDGTNQTVYGINNEFFYKLNSRWTAGFRAEWMCENDTDEENALGLTAGLNWKPCRYFTLRPELRYDLVEHERVFNAVDGPAHKNQVSFGVSGIVKF